MLHVCTHRNRALYARQLEQMHRQRYELFVRTRGWNLKVRDGGEYDEGDDERAVYLLALDEAGGCFSSIRVRPADDFSMVIDNMPHHVAGDAKALREDRGLWEMARWVNIGADPAAGQEIRIGLVEYLLGRGASQCLALPDASMMGYALRTGWRLRALGAPLPYPEGGTAVAVSLPITPAEAEHLRALTGRRDPFLMEIDPDAPWARLPLTSIEQAFAEAAGLADSVDALAQRADAALRRLDLGRVA
ncbi:MAG: acyl-homoserine-lactone synthase [Caulobacteraceae bacterium]|nr:acyl-homoserine-lactone synthase [Caulobacteraceae bacterium]